MEIVFWLLHQMLKCGPAAIPKGHEAQFGHELSLKALGVWLGAAPAALRSAGVQMPPAPGGTGTPVLGCIWQGSLKLILFWKPVKEQGHFGGSFGRAGRVL